MPPDVTPYPDDTEQQLLRKISAGVNAIPDALSTIGGGTSEDGGPAWESKLGLAGVAWTSTDQSASATQCTDAPDTGTKLVVTDLIVAVDTAMSVFFTEEDSTDELLRVYFPGAGTLQVTPRGKFKLTTADKRLMVRTSDAGNVYVTALYYSEA